MKTNYEFIKESDIDTMAEILTSIIVSIYMQTNPTAAAFIDQDLIKKEKEGFLK